MKQILWSETAKKDLQQIYDYIAEDSVYYADLFVDELMGKLESLKEFPNIGRLVPEIQSDDVREIFYHSYRVMYKSLHGNVYITQITHMSRNFTG